MDLGLDAEQEAAVGLGMAADLALDLVVVMVWETAVLSLRLSIQNKRKKY